MSVEYILQLKTVFDIIDFNSYTLKPHVSYTYFTTFPDQDK